MNLLNQLKIFSSENVKYSLWKNLSSYKQYNDPFDLDIYIHPKDTKKAYKLLKSNGWIRLKNPVADYQKISHFYLFTKKKTYHMHIYGGLRTGDSWLKNYVLPMDDFLLNNSVKDERGIYVLSEQAFDLIFKIRILIKNSTLIGRIIYKNSIKKYLNDSLFISCKNNSKFKKCLRNEFQLFIKETESLNIRYDHYPEIRECKKILKSLDKFLIIRKKSILFRQLFSLFIRLVNKLFLRFNKINYNKAKIVTFFGCDGSGKSTLVRNLFEIYTPCFPCSQAHLGKPFIENTFFKKVYSLNQKLKEKNNIENFKLKKGLKVITLSCLRLLSSYYQYLRRFFGVTILTDRWPSSCPNSMDGPKIFINNSNSLIVNLFNKLNIFIYKLIPNADLVIFLNTDYEKILERNAYREDSEPSSFLKKRYVDMVNSKPKSKKYIIYENNKKLEEAIDDCLFLVSNFINKD